MRITSTIAVAALLTASLAPAAPARADSGTFMGTFMIVSGVAMVGIGTAGLVEIYTSGPPASDDERQRRLQAEPFMWMGVTGGLITLGFAALAFSEEASPEEAPGAEVSAAPPPPSLTLAPSVGGVWGASAALRW